MNAARRSWHLINKQDVTCAPAESTGTELCFMNVPQKKERGAVRKVRGRACVQRGEGSLIFGDGTLLDHGPAPGSGIKWEGGLGHESVLCLIPQQATRKSKTQIRREQQQAEGE